jgi:hypothetical protein
MKRKSLISLFTLCIVLINISNCNIAQTKKNAKTKEDLPVEQITSMLRSFYTNYINACAELENRKADSIMNKYCTPKLLKYIHNKFDHDSLDYDPFLHSQMIDKTMLDNINIKKDSTRNDIYYFSYFRPYYKKFISIKLGVVKENISYKIDYIDLTFDTVNL